MHEYDREITVLGAITIYIDPEKFAPGDIVEVHSSAGKLQNDGGGEGRDNSVAELDDYTYAIGVPDTAFLEWNFGSLIGDITEIENCYKYHVLSYELIRQAETGFTFRIVNGINNQSYYYGKLCIDIAWESNEHDYAWELTSCLTS